MALVALSRVGGIQALGPEIQVADLAFAVAAGCAIVAAAHGTRRSRPILADATLALFGVTAIVSLAVTPSVRSSLIKLLGLGLLASLYFVGSHLAADPRRRRLLEGAWLAGAAVSSLAGIAGIIFFYLGARAPEDNPFVASYGSIPVGDYPRLVAFFTHPNMYCSYCMASLAILGMVWSWASPRLRPLLLVLAVLLVVNAAYTLSPGIGGLAIGLAMWWHLRGGRYRAAVLAAGSLVAAAFAAATLVLVVPRGAGDIRLGPVDVALSEGPRIDIWRSALRTWEKHPLTGIGYGELVASVSNPRSFTAMEHWSPEAATTPGVPVQMEAHNVWLNVLAQVGIFGLLAFAAFVGLVLRQASAQPAIFCGILAVFLYQGLFAAIEDARHVWLLFGQAVALGRDAQ